MSGSGRDDRAADVPLASDTVALVIADSAGRTSHLRASMRAAGTGCEQVRVSALALAGDTLPSTGTAAAPMQPAEGVVDLPLNAAGSSVLVHLWRDSQRPNTGSCRVSIGDVVVTTPP